MCLLVILQMIKKDIDLENKQDQVAKAPQKGKHAYLIMAHKQLNNLTRILNMLDDYRNDFYIHIDKKAGRISPELICKGVKCSKVIFTKRINTYWGASSLVDCELILLESCTKNEKYEYIHLLSGADLPIKSKEYILDFFDSHPNTEFLQVGNALPHINRLKHFHFLLNHPYFHPRIMTTVSKLTETINNQLRIDRLKKFKSINIIKVAQWFSITGECANYVLSQRQFIRKLTRHTSCPDEMFLGTILFGTPFWKHLYNSEQSWDGHMRYIDRIRNEGASPHTFTMEDKDDIDSSGMLFARKFDETVDENIIEYVFTRYSERNG